MTSDAGVVMPRRHARSSKRAFRSTHTAHNSDVVRAGLPGGQYRPLSDQDIQRIHNTALDILEKYGMADAPEEMHRFLLGNGCVENKQGRLCFPRALVDDCLSKACREFKITGLDGKREINLGGRDVNFGGNSYNVSVFDMDTEAFRAATLLDLYELVRLEDTLDNLHYVRIPVIAQDMETDLFDINSAYVMCAGTGKPFSMNISFPEYVDPVVELFDLIAGGEGRFSEKPFCLPIMVHVVPPLKFATESCLTIEKLVHKGVPVILCSSGMSGATSPAALAGMLAQTLAECFAGLIWVNLLSPGHPVAFGLSPLAADLRMGACTMGAAEQALMEAACAQLTNHYNLPGALLSGSTDAKLPDIQAGWERCLGSATIALAGGNHIGLAAGGHASNMGMSAESLVIDNDMLGNVLRVLRGVEVTDETLSFEAIGEAIHGEGHFMGHPETMALMSSEYYYPEFADRDSIKDWEEKGRPSVRGKAKVRAMEVIANHFPSYISPEVDEKIRQKFDIRLPREAMSKPFNQGGDD